MLPTNTGRLPSRYSSNPEERELAHWLNAQRQAYHKGKLDKEQIKAIELIPGWKWKFPSVSSKKKKLLNMAERKKEKPNVNSKLGSAFHRYTSKKFSCYDPDFTKKMRQLVPEWFFSQTCIVNEKKKRLLDMAIKKEKRPSHSKHELGYCLSEYTNPTNISYDIVFDRKIRKLAPHWFVNRSAENKKLLIDMIARGEKKPISGKHPLGYVLKNYITNSSKCFDANFKEKILKIRPDWLITQYDKSYMNKKNLLEIARRGKERPPHRKTSLGNVLCFYTNKNSKCYDCFFTEKLKKIRPDWFIKQSDKSEKKKEQLLEMARNKNQRPNQKKHFLGRSLSHYTNRNSSCYDPVFDKKIRKLAPHWFKHND